MPSSREFSNPGSNPHLLRLLHWQVGSLLLNHLGGPIHKDYELTDEKAGKKEMLIDSPQRHRAG